MKRINKSISLLLAAALIVSLIVSVPQQAAATSLTRTVMLYCVGSDLETSDMLVTESLVRATKSEYNEKLNFIVMTGGAKTWHTDSEYLSGTDSIDPKYNQIWKLEGKRGDEEHGKLTLLEESGIEGCAVTPMSSPKTLTAFTDYCYENYPADSYDLILWDHGGGPAYGFGNDCRGGSLSLEETSQAFSASKLIRSGKKFDLIDYDACLMGNVEVISALCEYADYFICSPEEVPGGGQNYKIFLDAVNENPSMSGFEIGRVIADDFVKTYKDSETDSECAVTAVVDVKNFKRRMLPLLVEMSDIMLDEATMRGSNDRYNFYDEIYSSGAVYRYGAKKYCLADTGSLASALGCRQVEENILSESDAESLSNRYTSVAAELMSVIADNDNSPDDVLYFGRSDKIKSPVKGRNLINPDGSAASFRGGAETFVSPTGLSLFYPSGNTEAVCDYIRAMQKTIEAMPDGNAKSFLESYSSAVACFSVIETLGDTIYALAGSGSGDIDYNVVKNESCSPTIDYLTEYVFHSKDEAEKYLSEIVRQQAEEAVSADKVRVIQNSRSIEINNKSARALTEAASEVLVWGEPTDLEFRILMSLHGYSYNGRKNSFPDGFSFSLGTTKSVRQVSQPVLSCELEKTPESVLAVYDDSDNPHIADIHYTDEAKTTGYIPIVVLKGLKKETNYYLYVSLNEGEWQIDGLAKKVGDQVYVKTDGEEFYDENGSVSYTTVSNMTDAKKGITSLMPISDFSAIDRMKKNWGMKVRELNLNELPESYRFAERYSLTDIYGNVTDITQLVKQSEAAPVWGDADGDGRLTVSDATAVQKYLAELPLENGFDLKAADTNSNGIISIDDATLIQKRLAEII